MANYKLLDQFEVPENLSESDAEYVRIKLSRCKSSAEAEKYRKQLEIIENYLLVAHNERVKYDSRRSI